MKLSVNPVIANGVEVDVVVRRWEQYTDRKATLADDGREIEQVAEDRAGSPHEWTDAARKSHR